MWAGNDGELGIFHFLVHPGVKFTVFLFAETCDPFEWIPEFLLWSIYAREACEYEGALLENLLIPFTKAIEQGLYLILEVVVLVCIGESYDKDDLFVYLRLLHNIPDVECREDLVVLRL